MGTVYNYVKLNMTKSRVENSLRKNETTSIMIGASKKSSSSFQAAKYLTKIAGAKSPQQVYAVISSLKGELANAKNCENYETVLRSIQKVKGKAERKIVSLVSERITNKKLKRAELERKKEESKKQKNILNAKIRSRKEQEHFDIYEGAKDDADMFKNEYNNIVSDADKSEDLIGNNINEVAASEESSSTGTYIVDTII